MKVLSFHPLFEGDEYRICAGRDPGPEELAAIRAADVVVLPQGCRESLYRMARENCRYLFPDYDVRFRYPRKPDQIRLFREMGAAHPATEIFGGVADFRERYTERRASPAVGFPLVFKFAWGGEGETVFRVDGPDDLAERIGLAEAYEKTGQRGFLLQDFVPPGDRALRVAVIGTIFRSYWRVASSTTTFGAGVGSGARIDPDADPHLQKRAVDAAKWFCRRTGIDLAGFDFIVDPAEGRPLFLEINYFFGRQGLGGSEGYYPLILAEIRNWIEGITRGS